jgi:REP element-mobilizing transposase RayT
MNGGERYYSRGKLPHWDRPGACQFLTWRLADSVPAAALDEWRAIALADGEERKRYWRFIEQTLDAGHGECLLTSPQASAAVIEAFLLEHAKLYTLHAFVVMPNHCHLLATISPNVTLGDCVRRLKGSSARAANAALGRSGRLWQVDYFDRLIRDDDHYRRTHEYIEWNPVKAGLCNVPQHFPASSAHPKWQRRLHAHRDETTPD